MEKQSGLILDIRPGEYLSLDRARIKVEPLHKSGQLIRLRVVAPPEVTIEKEAAIEPGACLAS